MKVSFGLFQLLAETMKLIDFRLAIIELLSETRSQSDLVVGFANPRF
tara:strand:- start:152 stop:292 length:141 start_codon:yes stop_codon:yes gene_type:complete